MRGTTPALAVLTSGGDSPGMNACLRAIVRAAAFRGVQVYGIRHGFRGLVEGALVPLHLGSVGNIIQRGGTFLGSSRCPEFHKKSVRSKAFEHLKNQEISGLITLGGDGTLTGAKIFSQEFPIRVIGVPCTIDNDLRGTDLAIGFDSAVNTAVEAIDKIRDTADSHGRVFLVEVMGRNTGHLALETALAVGAEFVVIPEVPYRAADMVRKVQSGIQRGKTGSIIIVAEKDQPGRVLPMGTMLQKHVKRDVRSVILGHLQRGGAPTRLDRNLGSRMGAFAVDLFCAQKNRVMVGLEKGILKPQPFAKVLSGRQVSKSDDYRLINVLSI
jgi:6-phosphofructokinase 1